MQSVPGAVVGFSRIWAGSKALIERCVRYRRMAGGAMRQSGILSAAGLYALDHNMARLADDHMHARLIGERLAASPRIVLDLATADFKASARQFLSVG